MKVLGFWAKLFTKCVAVEEFQTLSDTVEDLNKNVELKATVILDLKNDLDDKENIIKKLVNDVNTADSKTSDLQFKYDSVVKELVNEKDKLETTLKLLSDSQGEVNLLTQQLENRPVVTEDCSCGETKDECEEEEVLTSGETIGDGTFEKEDVLKGADAVVTTADKLQNFVNSLSRVQMRELKDDIIKGHSNDKRLTTTLKNWVKKFPDRLETQVYFMFKTALTRRRGKQQLGAWYDKYDNM